MTECKQTNGKEKRLGDFSIKKPHGMTIDRARFTSRNNALFRMTTSSSMNRAG